MKFFAIIFLCSFLMGCKIHTVINQTDEELILTKSGGEEIHLKPKSCISLIEYFFGLGGDFPFAIKEEEKEYKADNYEITFLTKTKSDAYQVLVGEKKENCEETEDLDDKSEKGQRDSKNFEKKVNCVTGEPICSNGVPKCKESKAVCVNEEDHALQNIIPSCNQGNAKCLKNTAPIKEDKSYQAVCESNFQASGIATCSEEGSLLVCGWKSSSHQEASTVLKVFCVNEARMIWSVPICNFGKEGLQLVPICKK